MSVFKSLVGSPASSRRSPKLNTPTSSSCRSPLMENASDSELRSSPIASTSSSSPLRFSSRHNSRDENESPRGLPVTNARKQRFHNVMGEENVLNDLSNKGIQVCSLNADSVAGGVLPLKRKKPPLKLNIPMNDVVVAASDNPKAMMDFMDPGIVQEPKSFDGGSYAYYSHKGKKRTPMEDAFYVSLDSNEHQAFFGVYDGHGGRKAVDFVSERLGQAIIENIGSNLESEDVSMLKQAVTDGYLTTETEFLKRKAESGVCAVTALIRDGRLVVANVGDCRAVISKDGKSEALTTDHKPYMERERIEKLGGYVGCRNGVWRVLGSLAVSRSIGDLHMKPFVSAEPDIREFNITKDSEFLILASDGLWDKVSNQDAVDIARPSCMQKKSKRAWIDGTIPPPKAGKVIDMGNVTNVMNVQGLRSSEFATETLMTPRTEVRGKLAACKELVDVAFSKGNIDDITVMIVDLRHFCCKREDTLETSPLQ